ncbi:MAG: PqqD family protein [Planctomycetes bacterium]|nr:PqqD family protein [Planctomycetota bacterium]NUQ35603.1 PqqD family protein [Planctomycetaceae bacterium]
MSAAPDPRAVIVRAPNVSYSSLDGEVLVIDTSRRKSHRLLETASFIWQRCDGRNTVDDIVAAMTSVYDVAHDDAERDVREMVGQWIDAGIAKQA